MHSRKAKQAYVPSAIKNRTRKKCTIEEDPGKSPEKNKKNEPLEQNKPEKRTKFLKTALQIAKNETLKDRKAKEQARVEKVNK